jgi:hypothetical protein
MGHRCWTRRRAAGACWCVGGFDDQGCALAPVADRLLGLAALRWSKLPLLYDLGCREGEELRQTLKDCNCLNQTS